MDDCERLDRQALMGMYGYRNKGFLGVVRLYCRQTFDLVLRILAERAPPPRLRVALQRARGVKIGKHVYLAFNVDIDNIRPDLVTIEDHIGIGARTMIFAHSNPAFCTEVMEEYFPPFFAPTTIKTGAWVGPGSIILAGVTIGEVGVVGAGAVVTKDVEPRTLVGGNPARVIRKLKPRADSQIPVEQSSTASRRVYFRQMHTARLKAEDDGHGAE